MKKSYRLRDAERMHRQSPRTFGIHSLSARCNLLPGDLVKLCFCSRVHAERTWVEVRKVYARFSLVYEGEISDEGAVMDLKFGDRVVFCPRHVYDIEPHPSNRVLVEVLQREKRS